MKKWMLRATSLTSLTALLSCGSAPTSSSLDESSAARQWKFVRLPISTVSPDFVLSTGFVRDHRRDSRWAFGYLKKNALDALPSQMRVQLSLIDEKAWAKGLVNPQTLEIADEILDDSSEGRDEPYHTFESLTTELQTLVQRYPQILKLESAGKSVQGRDLWYVKLSDNVAQDESEPKLLYISTMHGDEVTGVEMMVYLIRKLTSGYGQNARMTKLVDNAQIFIMPLMNPDGNAARQRWNANGADLNRDFPDFTSDPNDTLEGREPETQAIMRLHDQHHFLMALNFHGGEICFNLPWDTKRNSVAVEKFGDDALMTFAGREYISTNRPMYNNDNSTFDHGLTYGYEWYEVNGGMQDWSNYYRQSAHATVELSSTKWPNASELAHFWAENEESLTKYLERGTEGVHLALRSASVRQITNPAISVGSARREITHGTLFIHRPTVPGSQTVTIEAPGFSPLNLTLPSAAFDGAFQEVTLQPTP